MEENNNSIVDEELDIISVTPRLVKERSQVKLNMQ